MLSESKSKDAITGSLEVLDHPPTELDVYQLSSRAQVNAFEAKSISQKMLPPAYAKIEASFSGKAQVRLCSRDDLLKLQQMLIKFVNIRTRSLREGRLKSF